MQVGVQRRAVLHVVVELGEGGAVRGAKEGYEDKKLSLLDQVLLPTLPFSLCMEDQGH